MPDNLFDLFAIALYMALALLAGGWCIVYVLTHKRVTTKRATARRRK